MRVLPFLASRPDNYNEGCEDEHIHRGDVSILEEMVVGIRGLVP